MERESAAGSEAVRCAGCGEIIGVYEPLVHVVGGLAHRTSRAADPDLALSASGHLYHLACREEDGTGLLAVE